MLASNFVYGVVAAFAAFATAQTTDGTTTSTATMTRTITIVSCNAQVTNCPGRNTSSTSSSVISTSSSSSSSSSSSVFTTSTVYPTANLTSAFPSPSKNATSYVPPQPTKAPTTPVVIPTPPAATTLPAAPPAAGAGSALFVQSGLMLGLLGAGIAVLA